MRKKKKTQYWPDIYHNGDVMMWGVESSNPLETFDGHYILLIPPSSVNNEAEWTKSFNIATKIAEHLNKYSIKLV